MACLQRVAVRKLAPAIMGILLGALLLPSNMLSTAAAAGPATLTAAPVTFHALQDLAESGLADFAGISFDEPTHTVHIHVPSSGSVSSATQRTMQLLATVSTSSAQNWPIQFDSVTHSWSQLQHIMDRVTTDPTFVTAAHETLSQWSVNADSNTVLIGLTQLSGQVEAIATQQFGDMVSFAQVPRGDTTSTRLTDSAPFFGGDRLTMPAGNSCTSGFELLIGGVQRMLTDGHCALSGPVKTGSLFMGNIAAAVNQPSGHDTSIISGSYGYFIWSGAVTSSTDHVVNLSFLPPVGLGICLSGSFTGANCNARVVNGNRGICHAFTTQTTCYLGEAQSTNGSRICQGGDSGGPVYRIGVNTSSDLGAVGTIEGDTSDGQFCWYNDMPDLLSYWNASIAHG